MPKVKTGEFICEYLNNKKLGGGDFPGENLTFLQTMIVKSIILQIDIYFRFYILAEEAGAEVEEVEEAKEAEE